MSAFFDKTVTYSDTYHRFWGFYFNPTQSYFKIKFLLPRKVYSSPASHMHVKLVKMKVFIIQKQNKNLTEQNCLLPRPCSGLFLTLSTLTYCRKAYPWKCINDTKVLHDTRSRGIKTIMGFTCYNFATTKIQWEKIPHENSLFTLKN